MSIPSITSILPLLLVAVLAQSQVPSDAVLTIIHSGQSQHFTLQQLKQKLLTQTITLDDPIYHAQKSFIGLDFQEVLQLAALPENRPDDILVLKAKDGYAPTLSRSLLQANRALLAYAEAGKSDGQFALIKEGKSQVSPAPFYLVWPSAGKNFKQFPWSFQLVSVELVRFADRFDKVIPIQTSSPQVQEGFQLFKQNCLSCHSINLQGGEIGPELNAPKNVTEYWQHADLLAYIKNPSSYRYQSKMPAFPQFKDADIEAILAYLHQMKQQKIVR